MTKAHSDLVSAIYRGQALVIIGTGLSIDASDRCAEASWIGLLRSGLHRLREAGAEQDWVNWQLNGLSTAKCDALSLSFIADELRERMSRAAGLVGGFDHWLVEAVERIETEARNEDAPKALLQAILQLACPIATTNYDRILEQNGGLASITMDQEDEVAAFIRNDRKAVLHLHGLPHKPGSVVLGRQSYHDHVGSMVKTELQRAVSTICSCVFVGFGDGIRDLNFSPWFRWISGTLGASSIRHYVLLKDSDARAWPQQDFPNIQAVGYGAGYADLPRFLLKLRESANELASQPGPQAQRAASSLSPRHD